MAFALLLIALAVGASNASDEHCDAHGTSSDCDRDAQSALQTRTDLEAHTKQEPDKERADRECLAVSIALQMYGPHFAPAPEGVSKSKTYLASTVSGDTDKAELWTKDGACWLSFMGTQHAEGDYLNIFNYKPKEEWGIKGLHSGVVAELKPLIAKMDFSEIRGICTGGKLTVTGHSLGGGLAQIFSLAINKKDDPLNAKLVVDRLYTFGAMAISAADGNNDKAADGCFPGAQFWYAEKKGSTYISDAVALPLLGGQHTHFPSKSQKVFVFNQTAPSETYACGTPLPHSQSLMMTIGQQAWEPIHMNYFQHLGC